MAATSNSDLNSQDKGPTILALQWTLTVLATIFVAARIFVRTTLVKRMGLDDYLIILSLVSILEFSVWSMFLYDT